MILLVCDTSGPVCSAALLEDGTVLEQRTAQSPGGHAAVFMPMVASLLRDRGIGYGDIGLFACATGPGSFTGIRSGVAAVQAMAYAAGRPATGVSGLDALAAAGPEEEHNLLCPVIDARNGRVYTQITRAGGGTVWPPRNTERTALLDWLRAHADGPVWMAGTGARDTADAAASDPAFPVRVTAGDAVLDAAAVGRVAWTRLAALDSGAISGDPFLLRPVYLGRSQAERASGIDISDWSPAAQNHERP